MRFSTHFLGFFLFLLLIMLSVGCSAKKDNDCHPLLFPHVEYGYRAELQNLPGLYNHGDQEIIEFHGIRLAVPDGWRHEIALSGHSVKFLKERQNSFLVSFQKNVNFESNNTENFRFIGCDNFKPDKTSTTKNSRDYYTDLFSFTDEDIGRDSGFWEYSILWSKIEMFHDSARIIHYAGSNLEAFQNNIKPRFCECNTVHSRITIFPETIAPDFLTLVANDVEDRFLVFFIDMIDRLNP